MVLFLSKIADFLQKMLRSATKQALVLKSTLSKTKYLCVPTYQISRCYRQRIIFPLPHLKTNPKEPTQIRIKFSVLFGTHTLLDKSLRVLQFPTHLSTLIING